MAVLVYYDNDLKKYLELNHESDLLVGRSAACDINLCGFSKVSRRHCQFSFDHAGDCYAVTDLKSTNGIFINGRRAEGRERLRNHDEINVGGFRFFFYENVSDATRSRPILRVKNVNFSKQNQVRGEQDDTQAFSNPIGLNSMTTKMESFVEREN